MITAEMRLYCCLLMFSAVLVSAAIPALYKMARHFRSIGVPITWEPTAITVGLVMVWFSCVSAFLEMFQGV